MDKNLEPILQEMCSRVGADYESIDFKADYWYRLYSWNEEQEKDYTKWLADYLYNNKEARNVIMSYPSRNKKHCKKAAEMFIIVYGWIRNENS